MKRCLGRLAILFLVTGLFVLLVVMAGYLYFESQVASGSLARNLSARLSGPGLTVDLGSLSFPARDAVRLSEITLQRPDGSKGRIDRLDARWSLEWAGRPRLRIHELRLTAPAIDLRAAARPIKVEFHPIVGKDAGKEPELHGDRSLPAPSSDGTPSSIFPSWTKWLHLDQARIDKGRIAFDKAPEIHELDLELRTMAEGGFTLEGGAKTSTGASLALSSKGSCDGRTLALSALRVNLNGSVLLGKGSWPLLASATAEGLTLRAEDFDPLCLIPLLPDGPRREAHGYRPFGRAQIAVKLHPDGSEATLVPVGLGMALPKMGAEGLELKVARGSLRAAWGKERKLRLEDVEIDLDGMPLSLSAELSRSTTGVDQVQASLVGTHLSVPGLLALLPREQRRQIEEYTASGMLDVRVSVDGALAAPKVDGTVDLLQVALGSRRYPTVGTLAIEKGKLHFREGNLFLQEIEGSLVGARLDLKGAVVAVADPRRRNVQIELACSDLDLARLAGILPANLRVPRHQPKGKTNLTLSLRQAPVGPAEIQARLDLDGLSARFPLGEEKWLPLSFAKGQLRYRDGNLSLRKGELTVGQLSLTGDGDVKDVASAERSLDLHVSCEKLELERVLELLPPGAEESWKLAGLGGTLALDMTVQGRPDRPHLTGSVNPRGLTLSPPKLALPQSISFPEGRLRFEGDGIHVEGIRLRSGALSIRTSATIQDVFDEKRALDLEAELADTGVEELLRALGPQLTQGFPTLKARGRIAARARIRGPLAAPKPHLSLAVKDFAMDLPARGSLPATSFEIAKAQLLYDEGDLDVRSFEARVAKQDLSLSGKVKDLRERATWDLKVRAPRLDLGALWSLAPEGFREKLVGRKLEGALALQLELTGQSTFPRPTGSIRTMGLRLSATAEGGPSPLSLSDGILHLQDGRLRLEDLALVAGTSRLTLTGTIEDVLSPEGQLALEADGPKLACKDLLALLPPSVRTPLLPWKPEGDLALSVKVGGLSTSPEIDASLGLANLELHPPTPLVKDPLTFGTGKIRLRGRKLLIEKLSCMIREARLVLDGTLSGLPAMPNHVDLEARSDAFPLASLLAFLPEDMRARSDALGIGGDLPFRIRAHGALPRPDLQARIDLARVYFEPAALSSKTRLSFSTGSVEITTAALTLHPTTLRFGDANLEGRGSVLEPLSPNRRFDLSLKGRRIDLAKLTRILPTALRQQVERYGLGGESSLDLSWKGRIDAYELGAHLSLAGIGGRVPGVGSKGLPLRFASGSIRGFEDRLALRDVTLLVGPIPVALTGEVTDPLGKAGIRFRAQCKDLKLDTLRKTLPDDWREKIEDLALGGSLTTDLLLSGDRRKVEVSGSTVLSDGTASLPVAGGTPIALKIPSLEVDLSPRSIALRKATRIHLGPMVLRVQSLACHDYTGMPSYEGQVQGDALDLAGLAPLLPKDLRATWASWKPSGELTAQIDVKGSGTSPEIQGEVKIGSCRLAIPLAEAELPLAFGPGKLELRPEAFDLGGLPVKSRGVAAKLDLRIDSPMADGRLTAKLDIDEILPDALRPFLGEEGKAQLEKLHPQGKLAGFVKISAPLSKLDGNAAYLQLRPVALSVALPLEGTKERIHLSKGTLNASLTTIRLDGFEATLVGEKLQLDGSCQDPLGKGVLDLKLTGKALELAPLGKAFFGPEGVVTLGGSTKLSLDVTGLTTAPRWKGSIDLKGVRVQAQAMGSPLVTEQGFLDFDEKNFVARDVLFKLGSSMVGVSGKVLDYRGKPAFSSNSAIMASVQGRDLAPLLRLPEGYAFQGSAEVKAELRGALSQPTMSGELTMPKGFDFLVGQGKDVFKARVDRFASKVSYRNGRVAIDDFAGKAYDGTMSARASFIVSGAEPEFDGELALKHMNLDRFFSYGTNFDGCFHGDVEAEFRYAGRGTAATGVQGDGRVLVRGLRVEGQRTMDLVGWEKFMTPGGKKLGVLGAAALLFGASRSQKVRAILDSAGLAIRILRRRHDMGTVEARLTLAKGMFRADPIRCREDPARLGGHMALKLETTGLEGRLHGYVEGEGYRVALANILFSGVASEPTVRPEHFGDFDRMLQEDIVVRKIEASPPPRTAGPGDGPPPPDPDKPFANPPAPAPGDGPPPPDPDNPFANPPAPAPSNPFE